MSGELAAPKPLSIEAIRQIAIGAGIPSELANQLLTGGQIVLRDDGRLKVTLSVSVPGVSALARAICPVCRGDVAVRANGMLREHQDHRDPKHRAGDRDYVVPLCPGSGRPVTG